MIKASRAGLEVLSWCAVARPDAKRPRPQHRLPGFFDVFASRAHGQAGFFEAKVGPDRIKPTQLRFVEIALRFRSLDEFMIVEIAGASPQRTPARQPGTTAH